MSFSIGEHVLSRCQNSLDYPPSNAFLLGKLNEVLEIARAVGLQQATVVEKAVALHASLAPKLIGNKT